MTHKEILTKAIQKAIKNGWRGDLLNIRVLAQDDGLPRLTNDSTGEEWSIEEIIFNHAFAAALWGKQQVYIIGGVEPGERVALLYPTLERYKYHLQQMVISNDPIRYLAKSLVLQ